MQKRLKGSYRDIAYIELFENMYMRNTLNINLCCKEDASPFFHFGEHFSRFWLFLQGAGVCWDSESHYSPLENEFPFQRDVGKDGKMKVTARCEGSNERWNQGILGSKATGFVKNVLAERPSGRSQVSHPVCQDITVNRQCDSNSDLPAVSDFGLLGSICSSSCLSVVVAWAGLLHCCLLGAQEGAGSCFCVTKAQQCPSATSADLFCGYSHHHPWITLSPVKTVNLTVSV